MPKIPSEWLEKYYGLTAKGKKEAASWRRMLLRGSAFGKFSYGEVQVLNSFRRFLNQPRSLSQIWGKMEFGVTQKEMLRGITKLQGKGYIKRMK